jgi:hypothetical protein
MTVLFSIEYNLIKSLGCLLEGAELILLTVHEYSCRTIYTVQSFPVPTQG